MIRFKRTKLEFSALNNSYIIGDMKTLVESSIFTTVVHVIKEYAIFLIDPKGIVVTWNKGAESIKGYTQEEILGQNYSILFTLEDQASGEPTQQLTEALRMGVY